MSKLLRLRYLRYRQTPNNLKRVKAHAERREPSTLFLVVPVNFADFQITRIKADASQYVCYVLRYVTISNFVFDFYIYYFGSIASSNKTFSACKYRNYNREFQIIRLFSLRERDISLVCAHKKAKILASFKYSSYICTEEILYRVGAPFESASDLSI